MMFYFSRIGIGDEYESERLWLECLLLCHYCSDFCYLSWTCFQKPSSIRMMFHFSRNGNRYLTVRLCLRPLRCTWKRTPRMSNPNTLNVEPEHLTRCLGRREVVPPILAILSREGSRYFAVSYNGCMIMINKWLGVSTEDIIHFQSPALKGFVEILRRLN